jgi:hypothetical protein
MEGKEIAQARPQSWRLASWFSLLWRSRVTATGTARFAAAMDSIVGYVVGAIFDIPKEVLLVAVIAFGTTCTAHFERPVPAGFGLVTYSVLAAHATISTPYSPSSDPEDNILARVRNPFAR